MARARQLDETEGRLVENIVHFARALRKAGVKLGTAQVEDAVRAVEAAGFSRKQDYYHILRATLVNRAADLQIFHQIFAMFWRDPEFLEHLIHLLSPALHREEEEKARKPAERRASDALGDTPAPPQQVKERQEIQIDAQFSWSASETLRAMDFEQMSAAELAEATRALRDLRLPLPPLRSRRLAPSSHGHQPDLRATLRASMRRGGEIGHLALRKPKTRAPDLVVLCDISGSMSVYSRLLLHFLHNVALAQDGNWRHLHAFTFGTRLTNITRALHRKDPDLALDAVSREAQDWQGGTRIGDALERFNKRWSRRLLGQGAVVLLISDGLERGDLDHLRSQAERLSLSCKRLIWLNPLLRYDGFAPKAGGIRTLLPYTDSFHACHSLDSLADIGRALSQAAQRPA
ncbi:VWA domain-containing protein [Tropicimonas sp. TH_r6]|uniref:vWA domain-containing protein n=1 Tax=Tropicimonas sp. TH_r6 TaxID=3082085 RepID=UPI002954FEF8|nr:VWA domain-containing protein [Tropicimonas sp. TH_r6]MDV7142112.1 VWA domain-containing protein [Tropicimonas sp. TH_r6]